MISGLYDCPRRGLARREDKSTRIAMLNFLAGL
jgi:hypothetical protein